MLQSRSDRAQQPEAEHLGRALRNQPAREIPAVRLSEQDERLIADLRVDELQQRGHDPVGAVDLPGRTRTHPRQVGIEPPIPRHAREERLERTGHQPVVRRPPMQRQHRGAFAVGFVVKRHGGVLTTRSDNF
jgi:hypothetical protein